MAAKIYTAPKEIKLPENSFTDIASWEKNDAKYISELKTFLKEQGYNEKNTGEILQFPAADGYAMYMVASMKPLRLIHLELGDAWCFQYANLLTAKVVQEKIDQQNALNKIFGGKK